MKKLFPILALLCVCAGAQTTTTITGTIKDLTNAVVTSGKVTFTLTPSRDTTISGVARFSPAQVVCLINASGLIKAQDGVSVCTLTMNTALQPTGSYYTVAIWPYNVKTSSFSFYAVLATYDWSTVVPTPTTSPAQNFVDTFSNQSIGGAKTWSGTQIFNGSVSGPSIVDTSSNQTIGGNKSFTGIPYFVNPGAGTEIGAPLNACIANFSTAANPGVCIIAPGNYVLTQTVIKPQWVRIEGNNAVISISSLATPAIICATTQTLFPTIAGTYSRRGIANLTLIGNGPASTPYGIWVGGDPAGVIVSAAAADFMEVFDNVHVQNFGAQYTLGKNISQELWLGGTIMGGYASAENGVVMPTGGGGSENLTFSGTQFIAGGGNTGFAILATNANGSTINLDHVSVDYWGSNNASGCPNSLGTGQIKYNNGHLVVDGGHFETCSGIQIVSDTTAIVEYSILGGSEFTLVDGTHALSTAAVIQVAGGFAQVTVEAGTIISLAGGATQTIGAYVNNTVVGGQVYVGGYASFLGAGYNQVPALGGTWNAGLVATFTAGALTGYQAIGNLIATGTLQVGGGSALNLYKRATDTPGAITVNANTCTDRPVGVAGLTVASVIIPTANYAMEAGIFPAAGQAASGSAHYRICNVTAGNITLSASATFNVAILQ